MRDNHSRKDNQLKWIRTMQKARSNLTLAEFVNMYSGKLRVDPGAEETVTTQTGTGAKGMQKKKNWTHCMRTCGSLFAPSGSGAQQADRSLSAEVCAWPDTLRRY